MPRPALTTRHEKMTANQKLAQQAHKANITNSLLLLDQLREVLVERKGLPVEVLDWGHVGDMQYVAEGLTELVNFFSNEG